MSKDNRDLLEFFKDEKGHLSMSRLLCFLSFFPATACLFRINNSDALAWYLGAYVAGYLGGKFSQGRSREDREIK